MSWSLEDKPKTLRVNKSLAEEFSNMESPPHDRPLSERRITIYNGMLKEGQFRPVSWAKCYCKETGSLYRINGKHTSVLLSRLEEIPEFYAIIESFVADTLEDVAKLYSTYDSKTMIRNASDIYLSFAAAIPELRCLSQRIINLAVSGLGYAKWLDGYYGVTAAERAELLLDTPDFAIWLDGILSGDNCTRGKPLARFPVSAAMFLTWKKSQKAAEDFWITVRDETGSRPNLPDRILARWLATTSLNSGSGSKKCKNAPPKEFFVKSIHAWNAWRKDRTLGDLKFHPKAKVPVVV